MALSGVVTAWQGLPQPLLRSQAHPGSGTAVNHTAGPWMSNGPSYRRQGLLPRSAYLQGAHARKAALAHNVPCTGLQAGRGGLFNNMMGFVQVAALHPSVTYSVSAQLLSLMGVFMVGYGYRRAAG